MELNEAVRRIVGRHLGLVVALALLGGAAGLSLTWGQHTQYQATARLVLDAPDPQSAQEAQAIADTARALATGPDLIRATLAHLGLSRNPEVVARDDVSVSSLGTSGVMALTVIDSSPRGAVALANGLAAAVVKARQDLSNANVSQAVGALDKQMGSLQSSSTRLESRIEALDTAMIRAGVRQLPTLQARRSALAAQQAALNQRLAVLESERAAVVGQAALRPHADVVDPAPAPALPVPSRRIPDVGLGVALGLLLGLGCAALLETVRPTLTGRAALEREIGAPSLGELSAPPDKGMEHELRAIASNVALATSAARVDSVQIVAVGPALDLRPMARILNRALRRVPSVPGRVHAPLVDAAVAARPGGSGSLPASSAGPSPNGRHRVGLVLVTPAAVRRDGLDPAAGLVAISGWHVLGFVTYRTRRLRRLRERRERNREMSRQASPSEGNGHAAGEGE